jgi:hypothetical protein
MTRLTKRRLEAMQGALSAMLAGYEGEGDWPEGVSRDDMDAALSWVFEQLERRGRK